MFHGTYTALVTPFRDGAIDVAAFEKLIEGQIAAGITGVVAIGTT
ncbi:MAG: dihydrodipicolinate synthase family protein, partial [Chthoniobacterales bacterium]